MPNISSHGKYDRRCWINWSNYMLGNGLSNIYKLGVNYLPLYHYFLFAYAKLTGTTEAIILNINALKYLTLAFEFLGISYVMVLAKTSYKNVLTPILLSLLIILNPAFFYNTIFYGQVDGIYSSFLFISIFYGIKKKPTLSLVAFVIALNFKLQGITYAPLVLLINLQETLKALSIKKVAQILTPSVVLQIFIVLPFIINGDFGLVYNVVKGSQGKYPFVSMGAFNVWYYLLDDPQNLNDYLGIWGRSYRAYGQLMYMSAMFLALFPLIVWNFRVLIQKINLPDFSTEKILILGVLMSLLFFYLNTEMHSRYIHSAMIFAGAYSLFSKKYLIFGMLSVTYFLNMESSAKIIKGNILEYEFFIFNPVLLSSLFLVVIGLCFYELYKDFSWRRGVSKLQINAQ